MKKNKYIQEKSTWQLAGGVAIDLGKLSFASLVLGTVVKTGASDIALIVCGLILCSASIAFGIYIVNKK
ncbi:hypothetical protein AGMMS49982_02370 [Bacteroidia bacterium]|nr:hypothetical protein AGMMS49982_02370 [Bacteroidia bacterium]